MIDPRISLAVQTPSVSNAINIYENALISAQNREISAGKEQRAQALAPLQQQQAQQNIDINAQTLDTNRQNQRLFNIHKTGQRLKPFLDAGDIKGAQQFLLSNISQLQTRIEAGENIDITESLETLQKLQSGDVQGVLGDINAVADLYLSQNNQNKPSVKSYAPIMDPNTGQLSTPTFNPTTMKTELVPIKGAFGETEVKRAEREFKEAEQLSTLDISETGLKEDIKQTSQRKSRLISEYSGQRKAANNTLRKTNEITKLAERASQGIKGQSKLLASRYFSGIDASDEGAISSAYKSLTLDELAKFKGPTTDFEYSVAEEITGSLGQSSRANMARIASLSRAAWFSKRETEQFARWIKAGHSADNYGFDMNAPITFGRGDSVTTMTLQDLQDTAVANHIGIDDVIKQFSKVLGGVN